MKVWFFKKAIYFCYHWCQLGLQDLPQEGLNKQLIKPLSELHSDHNN